MVSLEDPTQDHLALEDNHTQAEEEVEEDTEDLATEEVVIM